MLEKWQKNSLKRKIQINNLNQYLDMRIRHLFRTDFSLQNYVFINLLPDITETQEIICNHIDGINPFLSVRFGLYEYLLCYQYLEKKCEIRKTYSDFIRHHISLDAGIFNNIEKQLDHYSKYILENLNIIDVMAYWRNIPPQNVFEQFYNKNIQHINVAYYYPYPFLHKRLPYWQSKLSGKRVLVVSSFAKTIKRQYEKRFLLWENKNILPDFHLITYEAVRTNGGQIDLRFSTWEAAVNYMKKDILKIDFDIALISCGAYGMPLAMELKRSGHKAIQWGGCFQLWFGILGGRWDRNPELSEFINSEWTYPSTEETPPLAAEVNDSSYWKPVGK